MRAGHLPDDELTPSLVPARDGALDELVRFGHRYHAYRTAGSLARVTEVSIALHDRWVVEHDRDPHAVLVAPVTTLRVALFHAVRARDQVTAVGDERDGGEHDRWIRVLVGSIGDARAADAGR